MNDRRVTSGAAALLLFVTLGAAGCRSSAATSAATATGQSTFVSERLFFGRNIPAGGTVSEAEWEEFLRTVITPRFPKGLTVWQGSGQWLDPRGTLVREPMFAVEVFHERTDDVDSSLDAIAAAYKTRFGQDAVLRVTLPANVRFY